MIEWPDFTLRWLASGPWRPEGPSDAYDTPHCCELEEVPDPWFIAAIDTRKRWECPVLARIGVDLAYDLIAGGS